MRSHPSRRGSAMLEFILCGIPMMFVWISIIQMSIGMWRYHTLQYAVKAAGAFIAHRGSSWVNAGHAQPTLADAANVLAGSAIGIPPSAVSVTWQSGSTSITCQLNTCQTDTTTWPPIATSYIGSDFTIHADYVFNNAIAFYSPGGTPMQFGAPHLPGYTHQFILF